MNVRAKAMRRTIIGLVLVALLLGACGATQFHDDDNFGERLGCLYIPNGDMCHAVYRVQNNTHVCFVVISGYGDAIDCIE